MRAQQLDKILQFNQNKAKLRSQESEPELRLLKFREIFGVRIE